MKISTKGRYGLRILLDLALNDSEKPRMIRDISESQHISEKYISRLIIELRKAGMVKSIRGSKGGYRISREPKEITLLDVVEVMEGPVSIVDCVSARDCCPRIASCVTREIWTELNNQIREALQKITLQEIIDRYRAKSGDGEALRSLLSSMLSTQEGKRLAESVRRMMEN